MALRANRSNHWDPNHRSHGCPAVYRQSDKFSEQKHILIISMLVCMLATGNYICSTGLILLFIFRVVHGLGFGAATVLCYCGAENLPPKRLGEGMGYFGIGESVCLSIGPVLGIAMLNMFDLRACLWPVLLLVCWLPC